MFVQRQGQNAHPPVEEGRDGFWREPVTDALGPAGSAQVAKRLDNGLHSIPAAVAWRLAHSCPLTHSLNYWGGVAAPGGVVMASDRRCG